MDWIGVLAGVPVHVEFQAPKLRRSMEPLLRESFVSAHADAGPAALRIRVLPSRRYETLDELRGDSESVCVFRAAEGWVLEFKHGRAWVHPTRGQAELSLDDGFDALPLKERQTAILMILVWLLSPRGRHVLHAAAVALKPDCAVLLAGESGNGKSSTFAALLGAGCEGIADDVTVISEGPPGFSAWPLALGVSLAPAAVAFAGPIAAMDEILHDSKQLVFSQRWARTAVPLAGLVQMRLNPQLPSHLEALSPGEALLGLLPAAGGVLLDDGAAATRLAALGRMVQAMPCFRLRLGRDLYGRGDLIRSVLAQALS